MERHPVRRCRELFVRVEEDAGGPGKRSLIRIVRRQVFEAVRQTGEQQQTDANAKQGQGPEVKAEQALCERS